MDRQNLIQKSLGCKCPQCGTGDIFKTRYSLSLHQTCPSCGFDLANNDSGDGPAVFLIFILGFTVVPAALYVEMSFEPPFWVHILLWTPIVIGLTIAFLRPVKSYVIALQHKHNKESKDNQ